MAKLPRKAICSEDRGLFMHACFQLNWDFDLLHQNSATAIKTFLNELIGGREML
jgi:hypothetical protein